MMQMKNKETLDEKLKNYSKSNFLPMHMPGHKRNVKLLGHELPYDKDITEIYDFDDLHHPEGILKEVQEQAKRIYQSSHSFLLVNGSTCGILAGIRNAVSFGDQILVARGCHKSVYHAIELNHLDAIYLPSHIDSYGIDRGVLVEDVVNALNEYPNIRLIILTSPTYEGVISLISDIVKVAHEREIPVLVDEAHGAHLSFMKSLCSYEALKSGADIVIQSLHKTLPALTQTALLHIQGNLIKQEEVTKELSIFETSSPSYILMDSISCCLDLIEEKGKKLFSQYEENLAWFYEKAKNFRHLKVFGREIDSSVIYDYGKIVILTKDTNLSGRELSYILREKYKIEVEMSSIYYVIAMSSICDTKENFERLFYALQEIDSTLLGCENESIDYFSSLPRKKMNIAAAVDNKSANFSNIKDAEDFVSQEYLWIYPPGVPFVVPGEVINQKIIHQLEKYQKVGIEVRSTYDRFPDVKVINKK